ncbi:MAG: hypothetical protein EXX96DRAFT_487257, partial [Benjaminiella poitrasii]
IPREHPTIEASFKSLNEKEKWKLFTGKIVENILHNFNKLCVVGHPSCFMILDLDDATYINEKLFTEEELEEMKKETQINIIYKIPQHLQDYINFLNCNNVKDLRMRLTDTQAWEREYDINKYHDLDWVKCTIHSYIRFYRSKELDTVQKEQWYSKQVWLTIDTVLNDIKNIYIIYIHNGKYVSSTSTQRKNKNKTIGSTSFIKRVKYGYECDMIVKERKASHENANEFGTSETGIKYDGTNH